MNGFMQPRTGGLLALAAVVVVTYFFLPNSFYLDVAIRIGINAIICVGLNLLIGYAGQISLGHAGFFGLGAYGSAVLSVRGWPPGVAMLVTAAVVAALAFALARPILKLKGHFLAMATLGTGMIISIAINNEIKLTGGPDGMTVVPFSLFGHAFTGERVWYWIVGGLLVFSVWLALNLIDSPVGRALRAVHGSEVAAETCGVNTTQYKVLVFVVSAVFASVAGGVLAHFSAFVTPADASFLRSVEFVTMVVFGGMASTYGAVVGAAILTMLPQVLAGLEDYEHVMFGAILIATMIFLPRGLLPSVAGLFTRRPKITESAS